MGFAFFTENSILNLYNLGLQNGQTFEVVCVGGGGGGGGNSSQNSNNCWNGFGFGAGIKGKNRSSGGGGGEVKFDTFTMNNFFENIAVVVGQTGGSYLENNNGANGGSSSFGSLISSNGGYGGIYDISTTAKVTSHPRGLTSSGGMPINKNALTNITQAFPVSYCGGAGGGGYLPGCKYFGGTPGYYIDGVGYTNLCDGSGLSGFMINTYNTAIQNNIIASLTEERRKVFNLPTQWGGKETTETGVVCIYW